MSCLVYFSKLEDYTEVTPAVATGKLLATHMSLSGGACQILSQVAGMHMQHLSSACPDEAASLSRGIKLIIMAVHIQ